MDIYGAGRGCNQLTGRFEVLEYVVSSDGKVEHLAVDFEQHCEGGSPALFGSVRINSEWVDSDLDGDGVIDPLDVCCNTPPGAAVDAVGRPIGDLDLDCDNDLADFQLYSRGFTGPLSSPIECP
jgi:hypothetical protein